MLQLSVPMTLSKPSFLSIIFSWVEMLLVHLIYLPVYICNILGRAIANIYCSLFQTSKPRVMACNCVVFGDTNADLRSAASDMKWPAPQLQSNIDIALLSQTWINTWCDRCSTLGVVCRLYHVHGLHQSLCRMKSFPPLKQRHAYRLYSTTDSALVTYLTSFLLVSNLSGRHLKPDRTEQNCRRASSTNGVDCLK